MKIELTKQGQSLTINCRIPVDSLIEKGRKRSHTRDLAIYRTCPSLRPARQGDRCPLRRYQPRRCLHALPLCPRVHEALPWDIALRTNLSKIEAFLGPPGSK